MNGGSPFLRGEKGEKDPGNDALLDDDNEEGEDQDD